ncbi:helix-turn-helix domain-containing protein [Pseudomonadota bacterium]
MMLPSKEKGHPPQIALSNTSKTKDTSTTAQRQRILERLRQGVATTIQIRKELDVMAPAPRIFELRQLGYEISTTWVQDETMPGHKHSVAQYALIREAQS